VLVLLAGVLVLPNLTWSQGPGGGGRGGRGINPEDLFYRFSGGNDVIVISTMDPAQQDRVRQMTASFGLTGDQITVDQFTDAMTKRMSAFGGKSGRRSGSAQKSRCWN
jgi:hypothetical protein